ncbi:alpha/beta fold hydrolase [Patulibacter americanus]|uniref:alpha/beta fold hydrolase n=1 Tax=Patulibacter americanus TaxID=588672 RepID=UPI0003B764A9|nr:alpha/beta fold hydrolase [Patulibacter americanus]
MTIVAEYTLPGVHVRDHEVAVPLDWNAPDRGPRALSITLFAREVVDPVRRRDDLPLLLFLQGGPGGKGPRPRAGGGGWLGRALRTHRVILMDQRGTGRSTPVDARTLAALGDGEAGAEYLSHFRADAIVADAEHLRHAVFGVEKWETLGQSYGGFLTLSYLSRAPEGLAACYVTGGLPGLGADADEVYRRTFPRMEAKNDQFYARYPHAVDVVARIADRLEAAPVVLSDGDTLSVRRLQTLGQSFGMATGFDDVHWLLDEAFAPAGPGEDGAAWPAADLSAMFLAGVAARTSFDDNPLYAVLQEVIYAQGAVTPGWAAERQRAHHPAFDPAARPLRFTGETMFPWMFEEIRSLRPFRPAAEALAARDEWPTLYDPDRLAENPVPVAAIVYHDDAYVDADLSLQTAREVGNVRAWVTNEWEHDGIRASGDRVLGRLMEMVAETGGPLR